MKLNDILVFWINLICFTDFNVNVFTSAKSDMTTSIHKEFWNKNNKMKLEKFIERRISKTMKPLLEEIKQLKSTILKHEQIIRDNKKQLKTLHSLLSDEANKKSKENRLNSKFKKSLRENIDCNNVPRSFQQFQTVSIQSKILNGPVYFCCYYTANQMWTVIQRRFNGREDFYKTWNEYKWGFGNISGEFWFGNEKIHQITNQGSYRLRIEMKTWTGSKYAAEYRSFKLSDEHDGYRLHVGGFVSRDEFALPYSNLSSISINSTSSNLYVKNENQLKNEDKFMWSEDSLTSAFENNHNNQKFSTKDQDNDERAYDNCAVHYQGAWWFNGCYKSHLNGIYKRYKKSFDKKSRKLHFNDFDDIFNRDGLIWDSIDEHISLKETIMMIKLND